jgi:hypothetical protein
MCAAFAASVVCGGHARGKVSAARRASNAASASPARLMRNVSFRGYRTLTSSGTPGPNVVDTEPFWM